jgi:two-component system, OmpR family, sensor histidine kinase VicK
MLSNVEIIENPKESVDRAYDICISAKDELLMAFPTINSFRRNVRTGMSMQLLKEEYSKNNVRPRILTPVDDQIMQIINELKKIVSGLDIQALNESTESNNRVTIVLADRKECLIVDIKDDKKDNVYEAVGLSIYCNVKSIVSSCLSIFEILWKQSQPLID